MKVRVYVYDPLKNVMPSIEGCTIYDTDVPDDARNLFCYFYDVDGYNKGGFKMSVEQPKHKIKKWKWQVKDMNGITWRTPTYHSVITNIFGAEKIPGTEIEVAE